MIQILLRQKYYDKSTWKTIRVQIWLSWIDDGLSNPSRYYIGNVSIVARYKCKLSSSSFSSLISNRTIEFISISTSTTSSASATSITLLLALSQIFPTSVTWRIYLLFLTMWIIFLMIILSILSINITYSINFT